MGKHSEESGAEPASLTRTAGGTAPGRGNLVLTTCSGHEASTAGPGRGGGVGAGERGLSCLQGQEAWEAAAAARGRAQAPTTGFTGEEQRLSQSSGPGRRRDHRTGSSRREAAPGGFEGGSVT